MFCYCKVLIPLLLSLSTSSSHALKCGQWNTHACLADTDIRYDPDYTNDIAEQSELWNRQAGFYVATQESENRISHFNPSNLTDSGGGLPYDDSALVTYVNVTIAGSRRVEHRYVIYPPAPQEFCDLPVPPGSFNALGGGECGVNGFASFSEIFYTSSHEKDGTIKMLGLTFGFTFDTSFVLSNDVGTGYPVDSKTFALISSSERPDGGRGHQIKTWVFTTDDYKNAAAVAETYNANTGVTIGSIKYRYVRLDEKAFIDGLNAAWDANKVQADIGSRGGEVPMQAGCMGSTCPTEEQWCTLDPNCSESPYQEPPAKIKAGVVAGFASAAGVVLLGIVVGFYNLRLNQQKERIRVAFATRIAETIKGDFNMDPDALKEEFKNIDSGKEDGGDGYISKEELRDFMASGKLGIMDQKDFDMLFLALDVDGDGQVDYLEFCSFLKLCSTGADGETFRENEA